MCLCAFGFFSQWINLIMWIYKEQQTHTQLEHTQKGAKKKHKEEEEKEEEIINRR